jgi:ketosteroid isomerase-like protein
VHFLEKRANRWLVVSNAGHPLNDGAILLYMEQEWNDAEMKRDVTWHERSYSDDFTGSARNGVQRTKSEDIASVSKSNLDFAELSDLDVRVEGNTGVVTGVNHVKGKDEKGVAFDRNVRFTDTFVKRDGRWLVWASQSTDIK